MAKLYRFWAALVFVVAVSVFTVQWSWSPLTSHPACTCDVTVTSQPEDDVIGPVHERRCHGVTRPAEPRHSNTTWTTLTLNKGTLLNVFSAYYDDRTFRRQLPSVRLLLTSSGDLRNQDIHCQLWYSPNIVHPYVTKATVISLVRISDTSVIPQYIINCEVFSTAAKPSLVSLTAGRCENGSSAVRVVSPVRTRWQHQFGVCVPDPDWTEGREEWVVEWVEAYRLLGVGHVTAYNMSLSKKAGFVMENYATSGQAEIVPITNDIAASSSQKPESIRHNNLKAQSPYFDILVNDCLLRNMYRYKYTIVANFDQIIMSTKDLSYTELIKRIKNPNMADLWFDTYFAYGPSSVGKDIKTQPKEYKRAFIVNPDLCTYITNTTCRSVEQTSTNQTTNSVQGRGNHIYFFDGCRLLTKDKCQFVKHQDPQTGEYIKTDFDFVHSERLKERVKRRHEMIRLDYDW